MFSVNALDVTNRETFVYDEVRINEGDYYDPTTGIYTGTVPSLVEYEVILTLLKHTQFLIIF